jgi:hypothetical protein
MRRKKVEEVREMMKFDLNPTSFFKMIEYFLVVKLPPIFTGIYFILLGICLIILMLFLAYYQI